MAGLKTWKTNLTKVAPKEQAADQDPLAVWWFPTVSNEQVFFLNYTYRTHYKQHEIGLPTYLQLYTALNGAISWGEDHAWAWGRW